MLRSRFVAEHACGAATPATLQALLRAAAQSLPAMPRDRRLYRALGPPTGAAKTQEAAAERLGLPFSIYRYQLTDAIARVMEWLWRPSCAAPWTDQRTTCTAASLDAPLRFPQ